MASILLIPGQIKAIRNALQHSQDSFAALLNVSPRTIIRWESGETKCTGRYHLKLLKMLNDNSPETYDDIEDDFDSDDVSDF